MSLSYLALRRNNLRLCCCLLSISYDRYGMLSVGEAFPKLASPGYWTVCSSILKNLTRIFFITLNKYVWTIDGPLEIMRVATEIEWNFLKHDISRADACRILQWLKFYLRYELQSCEETDHHHNNDEIVQLANWSSVFTCISSITPLVCSRVCKDVIV